MKHSIYLTFKSEDREAPQLEPVELYSSDEPGQVLSWAMRILNQYAMSTLHLDWIKKYKLLNKG